MAPIAQWLNEQQQADTADAIVENTLHYLTQRSSLLDGFMPPKVYDTFDILQYVVEDIRTVASVVAAGQDVPLRNDGKFSKISAELFKAGTGRRYDETKQRAMRQAMREAALRNITVQNIRDTAGNVVQQGTNGSLADYLFGSLQKIALELTDLLQMLAWQAVQFGVVSYQDPLTNQYLNLDYRDPTADYGYAPNGIFAHFPPDLTGTSKAWDQRTTANGLQDLEEDVEQFIETNGFRPRAVVMSRKQRRNLLNQESTRQAVAAIYNTSANTIAANVGQVGFEMLSRLLADRDLPQLIIFDEQYQIEPLEANGKPVKRRFLNDDRYVFLTEGMGEQAMGPTVEGDFVAGMYITTYEQKKVPVVDVSQGVATMLPIVPNPKLLFSRRVA